MDRSGINLLYISRGYTTHDRRFLVALAGAGYHVSHLRLAEERLDARDFPAGVTSLGALTSSRSNHSRRGIVERARALRGAHLKTPDLTIAGPIQSGTLIAALAGLSPLVAMSWGTDILVDAGSAPSMRRATRFALSRSAGAIGDCRAVRESLKGFSTLNDDSIVTFPWGIDLADFRPGSPDPALVRELGLTGRSVVISTRSWETLYRIDVLVEAVALARDKVPNLLLLLLGDGSEAPSLRKRIAKLKLEENVRLPGRVPYDMQPDYFRLAQVYVSSAQSDGTSISLLEAMAMGLPAIVTGAFGNLEWVEPERNGWLTRPGDPEDLACALVDAFSDPARLERMGAENMKLAQTRADWPRNFTALPEFIDRILARERGAVLA